MSGSFAPPKTRFFDKVIDDANGCHIWTACRNKAGYGMFGIEGRIYLAHRLAWEWENGPIPDSMHVCHACDVPACVNTSHLFLGTQADNMADKVRKGRDLRGERHCRAKLSAAQVRQIRSIINMTHKEIALLFGVSRSAITRIRNFTYWNDRKAFVR
jgi:hypothetical protein